MIEALILRQTGRTLREIGKHFRKSPTTISDWIKVAEGANRKGKSVKAQALPTDRRGQSIVAAVRDD